MKGYKGFDKNLRCREFQYEVGKEYQTDEKPVPCKTGFHFCASLMDVHEYYNLKESRICEVEALGAVVTDGNKSATDRIKILRELSREEVLSLANTGKENTGLFNSGDLNSGNRNSGDYNSGNRNSGDYNSGNYNSGNLNSGDLNSGNRNSGDYNSGNRNSGDYNSGNRNSGDLNSGDRNSGDRNSGNRNSGNRNSGDYNSGDRNSGDRNSGDLNSGDLNSGDRNSGDRNSGNRNSGKFNSCDFSAGVFMSRRISFEAFNKTLTETEFSELTHSSGYAVCKRFSLARYRVRTKTGKFGDWRHMTYKASWRVFWSGLSFDERCAVRKMPHLDKAVFEEITGVKL